MNFNWNVESKTWVSKRKFQRQIQNVEVKNKRFDFKTKIFCYDMNMIQLNININSKY